MNNTVLVIVFESVILFVYLFVLFSDNLTPNEVSLIQVSYNSV